MPSIGIDESVQVCKRQGATTHTTMNKAEQTLFNALKRTATGNLVVVTGAGVSLASGIATFRGQDRDAVWKRDVTELGTYRYFETDPVGSWQWYLDRFDGILDKQPNGAHVALVALESWQCDNGGQFQLITQNVDTLHEKAGLRSLIKVHGSADRARCSADGCDLGAPAGSVLRAQLDFSAFHDNPSLQTLPRCSSCDALMRQHVLWFDEFYDGHLDYQWTAVLHAASTFDLVVFVGTSFSVGVTELFLQAAELRSVPAFSIDPGEQEPPSQHIVAVRANCEQLLPDIVRRLT